METSPFFILHASQHFPFPTPRKAMQRSTTPFTILKQRFHKSQFLQKLSCQKTYWDQARLSSLVNKKKLMGRVLSIDQSGVTHIFPLWEVCHVELYILVAFPGGGGCCGWAALHVVQVRPTVLWTPLTSTTPWTTLLRGGRRLGGDKGLDAQEGSRST